MAFVAEYETISVLVRRIPIRLLCSRREKPKSKGLCLAVHQCRPVSVMMHVEGFPIIHPRALKMTIGDLKSQGVNQVQTTSGKGAHTTDVASVLGDFRFEQYDVQHRDVNHRR